MNPYTNIPHSVLYMLQTRLTEQVNVCRKVRKECFEEGSYNEAKTWDNDAGFYSNQLRLVEEALR